jgi:aminomethyltransferase
LDKDNGKMNSSYVVGLSLPQILQEKFHLMIKNTPLTAQHRALGAKMAAFAGYDMPISYSTITDEHFAVRKATGVFDVSHMGEFIVRGRDAQAFLQSVTSNDVSALTPGKAQYSCLPNAEGGIVDDLIVYCLDQNMGATGDAYMLVVNASNEEKDWDHLQGLRAGFEVDMINVSAQTGLLAVQGPGAAAALQPLTNVALKDIAYYHFQRGTIAGCDNVIISATGYTGSGGFELYARNEDIPTLWGAALAAGAKPCGLGARDTLRLEMGFCLYGNDIDDTTSPLEAGLGWITKLNKGTDFPSSAQFQAQKTAGVSRKMVGFTLNERRVPRHGYEIESADGQMIGVVTSGTHSPMLDQPIGMGYVATAFAKPGTSIQIVAGGKRLAATVVKVPFV